MLILTVVFHDMIFPLACSEKMGFLILPEFTQIFYYHVYLSYHNVVSMGLAKDSKDNVSYHSVDPYGA